MSVNPLKPIQNFFFLNFRFELSRRVFKTFGNIKTLRWFFFFFFPSFTFESGNWQIYFLDEYFVRPPEHPTPPTPMVTSPSVSAHPRPKCSAVNHPISLFLLPQPLELLLHLGLHRQEFQGLGFFILFFLFSLSPASEY